MVKQGQITEEEYKKILKEIMTRRSEVFDLVKDVMVFKCPKCGFTDEVLISFRKK